MKKFLSLMVVAVLLCGLAVPAFALEPAFFSIADTHWALNYSKLFSGSRGSFAVDINPFVKVLNDSQKPYFSEVLDTINGKNPDRVALVRFVSPGMSFNNSLIKEYVIFCSFDADTFSFDGTASGSDNTLTLSSDSTNLFIFQYFPSNKGALLYSSQFSSAAKITSFCASNPSDIPPSSEFTYNPNNVDIPYRNDFYNIKYVSDALTFNNTLPQAVKKHTVRLVDSGGSSLKNDLISFYKPGTPYEISSPEIPGYTPDKPTVSGTMPDHDETITVTYTKIPLEVKRTLTVNYIDQEGNTLSPPVVRTLVPGAVYEIPSPEIPGYTPDKPTVSGTMADHDETITVTYTKPPVDEKRTLTIHYVYEDGTAAASSVVKTLASGETYKIDSPAIDGKVPDRLIVSGTMPDHDETITVTYIDGKFPLTITYKYKSGATAAPTFTGLYVPGSSYEVDSPAVAGFAPDQPVVSGTMPTQALTVAVVYAVNSGGGGDNPGGGSGGGSGGGDSGGGGSSGGIYDPFEKPDYPAYDGYDPFKNPYTSGEIYKGYDPFKKPDYEPYTSKSPFDYFLGR